MPDILQPICIGTFIYLLNNNNLKLLTEIISITILSATDNHTDTLADIGSKAERMALIPNESAIINLESNF